MKFNSIVVNLVGLVGALFPLSVIARGNVAAGDTSSAVVLPRQNSQHQNVQAVVEWLTSRGVMDRVSATELALSLTPKELDALAEALSNPNVHRVSDSITVVRGN